MSRRQTSPHARVALRFDESLRQRDPSRRARVASMTRAGDYLWLAFGSSTTIERLQWDGEAYSEHRQFDLAHFVDLPDNGDGDAELRTNIEGLDIAEGFLWVVASVHVAAEQPDADQNRYHLVRLPVVVAADGHPEPRKVILRNGTAIVAASMKTGKKGNKLIRVLREDDHIGPYMALASEANGFAVRGLTVVGERLFLGLGGPVLNDYAVVIEVQFKLKKKGRRLKLRKIGKHDERYRKHFFNLDGSGVRGCYTDPADGHLYILAGPTVNYESHGAIWGVQGGIRDQHTDIFHELERLFDVGSTAEIAPGSDMAGGLSDHVGGGQLVAYASSADSAEELWAEVVDAADIRIYNT